MIEHSWVAFCVHVWVPALTPRVRWEGEGRREACCTWGSQVQQYASVHRHRIGLSPGVVGMVPVMGGVGGGRLCSRILLVGCRCSQHPFTDRTSGSPPFALAAIRRAIGDGTRRARMFCCCFSCLHAQAAPCRRRPSRTDEHRPGSCWTFCTSWRGPRQSGGRLTCSLVPPLGPGPSSPPTHTAWLTVWSFVGPGSGPRCRGFLREHLPMRPHPRGQPSPRMRTHPPSRPPNVQHVRFAARRVGEAALPGPPTCRILVANVTSLHAAWPLLSDLQWDICLLQEVRVARDAPVLREIRAAGVACSLSAAVDTGKGTVALCAILTRNIAVTVVHCEARILEARVFCGAGPAFHIASIYGDCSGHDEARMANSALMRDAVLRAEARGPIPTLLCGDLQAEFGDLPCCHSLIAGSWCDIGHGPTCFAHASSTGRRIDWLCANKAMQRITTAQAPDWSVGLATHAAQLCEVQLGQHDAVPYWTEAEALPHIRQKDPALIWAAVPEPVLRAFRAAAAADDVEAAWEALLVCIASFWRAAGHDVGSLTARQGSVSPQKPTPPTAPNGDAAGREARKQYKRHRRLKEVARMWPDGAGAVPHHIKQVVRKLLAAEPGQTAWATAIERLLLPGASRVDVERLLAWAEGESATAAQSARQERRDRWHEFCNSEESQAKVFRYLRSGPRPVTPYPVLDPPAAPGARGYLAAVDTWWWHLWGRDANPQPDAWLEPLRSLPPFPAVGTLWGGQVWRTIKSTPIGKAPGRDGWRYAELRAMGTIGADLLAAFYTVVERAGTWPNDIRHSFVAMLPKGGSQDPDDRRPIVLLSVIYRVWAKARGPLFQRFLKSCGILPTGTAPSAADLAYDTACRIALHRTGGTQTHGLALDWSKCYDHLVLRLLQDVATAAGIPPAIAKPMLSAYQQPRAVILDGMVANERSPTAGLAPGCPRATDWLAMVVHCYTVAAARMGPVRPRAYVDDITTEVHTDNAGEAVELVQELVNFTQRFAGDFAWRPNMQKSRRFSVCPAVRSNLQALPGPPVATAFVDLGTVQAMGRLQVDMADRRFAATEDRFLRAASLAMGLRRRQHFLASSCLAATLFASAANPWPEKALGHLERYCRQAIWRCSPRSAVDVVFAHFTAARADPRCAVLLNAVLAASGAVVRGVLTGQELAQAVLQAGTLVGPFAALRVALQQVGATITPQGFLDGQQRTLAHGAGRVRARQWVTAVVRAWRLKRLTKSRPSLAAEWSQADLGLTLTKHPRWDEDRAAALRVLQSGGALPQAVAGKWAVGGTTCPHCKLAVETLQHRLWDCPAWDRHRSQLLQGHTREQLASQFGQPALLSGVIPSDPVLLRAAAAARQAGAWPPPRPLHTVYTDGSCVHPTDSVLRRAAWAAVGPAPRFEVAASAPVFGDQTIGRAELSALIWAHRCNPAQIVVDAQYLVTSLAATGRPGPEQLHGPNGDLWALLVSEVRPVWVKAHLSRDAAHQLGFPDDHWWGNDVADRAASALAKSLLPAPALLAARQQAITLAGILQAVISRVQLAAIAANRSVRHVARRVHKPLWRRPKRRKAAAPAKPQVPLRQEAQGQPVCCQLAPLPGPVRQGRCLGVRCLGCGRTARTQAKARKLGAALCPGFQDPAAARRAARGTHELQRCRGGWHCVACHLLATPSRRAAAARARCPMPQFWQAARLCVASEQQVRRNWAICAALFSPKPAPSVAPVVEAPEVAASPLRWRDHQVLTAPSHTACLRCGAVRVTRRRAHLLASSCASQVKAQDTAQLRTMLRAGVFDQALQQATPEVAALATSMGWQAVGCERGPFVQAVDHQRDMAPD
jgi:hypothetical protein